MSWENWTIEDVFNFGPPKKKSFPKNIKKAKIKTPNPFLDGLDLGNMDKYFGNFPSGGFKQSEFASGDFLKYVPSMNYKPPKGYGKESKKSKARRTVSQAESPVLYGLEGLENTLGESFENLEKGAKQAKENFGRGPTKAKAFYKRKFEKDTRIPRKIVEKIKSFKTRRKISKSLQPEYQSNIGFDKSREVSSTYGKTIPDPKYEQPERKYDYDDEFKEKYK